LGILALRKKVYVSLAIKYELETESQLSIKGTLLAKFASKIRVEFKYLRRLGTNRIAFMNKLM
jgi:hypothetical protein